MLEASSTLIGVLNILILILIGLLGWLGSRLFSKLDMIELKLSSLERGLRSEVTQLERRVIKLEVVEERRAP